MGGEEQRVWLGCKREGEDAVDQRRLGLLEAGIKKGDVVSSSPDYRQIYSIGGISSIVADHTVYNTSMQSLYTRR